MSHHPTDKTHHHPTDGMTDLQAKEYAKGLKIVQIIPIPSNIRVTAETKDEENPNGIWEDPVLAMVLRQDGEIKFLVSDSGGDIHTDEFFSYEDRPHYTITREKDHQPKEEE